MSTFSWQTLLLSNVTKYLFSLKRFSHTIRHNFLSSHTDFQFSTRKFTVFCEYSSFTREWHKQVLFKIINYYLSFIFPLPFNNVIFYIFIFNLSLHFLKGTKWNLFNSKEESLNHLFIYMYLFSPDKLHLCILINVVWLSYTSTHLCCIFKRYISDFQK